MKEHREEELAGPLGLLVSKGARPRELGAVLQALARVRAARDDALELQTFGDVEELLGRKSGGGLAMLEYEAVPAEDIGFVRRFLERNPSWHAYVLGDDAQDPRARGLLALPRTRWLAWPPDLDQLGALLSEAASPEPTPDDPGPPGPSGSGHPGTEPMREIEPRPSLAAVREPAEVDGSGLDVGGLLEELLAGASLSGDGSPRYLYRCERPLELDVPVVGLPEALVGLFGLARVCAGEGNVVSVTADLSAEGGSPGHVRVRADFPLGLLTDGDLPGLFEAPFDGEPAIAREVELARGAAHALRDQGATVELFAHRAGRLRLEILLPRVPAGARGSAQPRRAAADGGRPGDPFA